MRTNDYMSDDHHTDWIVAVYLFGDEPRYVSVTYSEPVADYVAEYDVASGAVHHYQLDDTAEELFLDGNVVAWVGVTPDRH